MAKRTATKTSDLEAQLTALVDHVAPGNVTICKSRVSYEGKPGYEVTVDTRQSKMSWISESVAHVVADAADEVDSPDEDPIRPAWRRLTRMQREVVLRTLQELGSKHMALAAAAKIARSPSAHAEYELADAFHAANEELDFFETDEEGRLLPEEKLAAEPIHVVSPRHRGASRTVQ